MGLVSVMFLELDLLPPLFIVCLEGRDGGGGGGSTLFWPIWGIAASFGLSLYPEQGICFMRESP